MTPEEIQRLSYLKALKLEKLIEEIEKKLSTSSNEMAKIILKMFIDKLDTSKGKVLPKFDRNTLTLFNSAFKKYQDTVKAKLVESIVNDIDIIVDDNDKYYKNTVKSSIPKTEIKKLIDRRLGINENGSLVRYGYMSGLLDDSGIRSELQKHIFREMFKNASFEAFRTGVKTFIVGEPDKFGMFQRYYKTFSFDAYAQLNSFTSATYAQKLGLSYFIYNGGLIKTSRSFCKKRNGEVFSTEEAEKWKDDPTLTAIESKETYNWVIDRGGFNCRHTPDFIAQEIAFVLRPDLNK